VGTYLKLSTHVSVLLGSLLEESTGIAVELLLSRERRWKELLPCEVAVNAVDRARHSGSAPKPVHARER
jgi:hypothetical protein